MEDFEKVLSNWIAEANAPEGRLVDGISPVSWVAKNVASWWRERTREDFDGIEAAARAIRWELDGLGGWKNGKLSDTMHELTHLNEGLADLRRDLGMEEQSPEGQGDLA